MRYFRSFEYISIVNISDSKTKKNPFVKPSGRQYTVKKFTRKNDYWRHFADSQYVYAQFCIHNFSDNCVKDFHWYQ